MDKPNLPRLAPLDVQVRAARERAKPIPFRIQGTTVFDLLIESVNLAKLVATEARDLEAIRSDHTQRMRHLEAVHMRAMGFINGEYKERSEQVKLLNENVKLLIEMNQFEIAQQIMNRLADILADSPLKRAMNLR